MGMPHVLPLCDVVTLYARRWDIELAFRAIKDHLNLHHVWSAKEIEVPWIDPCWIVSPPPRAVQPRKVVRYRSRTKGTGTKRPFGRVRLIHGKRHFLE